MARNGLLGLLAVGLFSTLASPVSSITPDPVPGSSGTDTSLPDTDSAVTVRGRGDFSSLELKVNQTRNLVNQAVSVTWTGGAAGSRTDIFDENYLQMMQCWGEDDGSTPANPGPPPEQCVFGATNGAVEFASPAFNSSGQGAITRVIGNRFSPDFDPDVGVLDPKSQAVFRAFRSVDGTEIGVDKDFDFNPTFGGGNFWLNPYFDITTTNEIAGSRTRGNGTGSELMEITTGIESSGLGCGQRLPIPGGSGIRTPKCWLVIVPRGTVTNENAGTGLGDGSAIATSPLRPESWKNRIAIPLEFNPVDTACVLGGDDRRIVGTELVLPAVASWQPALCATPGLPSYSYANVSDASARQQILTPSAGAPGMALVQKAAPLESVNPRSPVVYAPVALSGAVIGFTVERVTRTDASPEAQLLNSIRVADINLTPRLVAKLLTQSYANQLTISNSPPPLPAYAWLNLQENPGNVLSDPDFIQFNPEFATLRVANGRNVAGLLLPGANSDAAEQVWKWVLADPEAKTWLDGTQDPWGMKVNPVYSTNATLNSNGFAFADPVPNNFPKSDPYCFQFPAAGLPFVPPGLCGTDWLPYTNSFREAAKFARFADDRARIERNPSPPDSSRFWVRGRPQTLGTRSILSLTDTASAAAFGIQSARLSRAGDNGPNRTFIEPDAGGLTAGLAGMKPGSEPSVLEADPSADVPLGYPLTTLTYGMIRPLTLDAGGRSDYAAFVDYAVGGGQVSGLEPGQLPRGFATLPQALRDQAKAAAVTIRDLQPPADPAPPTTPAALPPPASSSAFAPASPGSSSRPPTSTSPAPASNPTTGAVVETASAPAEEQSSGLLTPILALARNRFFIPILALVTLLSALGALEITKRPRRAAARSSSGAS